FLMGVGPLAKWKQAEIPELASRLTWAFGVALVTALLLPFTLGRWTPLVFFGLLMALWIAAAGAVNLRERLTQLARTGGGSPMKYLKTLPRGYYGMLAAHFGVAVFIVGVTLVKGFETEKDVRMASGDVTEVGGYTFRLDGLADVDGPNYRATRGTITVLEGNRRVAVLYPEKRLYTVQQMPMTEAAIDTGFARDLYVSLGEPVGDGAWVVRVYHKPFVDWIWGGAFIMALGGILAVTDRRYRLARRAERSLPAAVGVAAS
ncbi:MAG TPA: cytochrome c-type biogenesis CcmF C-terminal domain-containing protein, partial [Burkholderiales bacterium]|nr:cytochrome c-type biogenesis CcmF C-terminal domain-containing protein [Burkholderiales bacterium]